MIQWLRSLFSDKTAGAPLGPMVKLPLGGIIRDIAFSPDGTLLATCSDRSGVCFWDAATGAPVGQSLKPKKGKAVSVCFSPDGRRVVVEATEFDVNCVNDMYVWDVASGQALLTQAVLVETNGSSFEGRRFDTSGTKILASGDCSPSGSTEQEDDVAAEMPTMELNRAAILDAATGECLWRTTPEMFSPEGMLTSAFSADGRYLLAHVVSSVRHVVLVCTDTDEVVEIGSLGDVGEDIVMDLCVSDDGRYAAWNAMEARRTFVWDIARSDYACPPITTSEQVAQLCFSSRDHLAIGTQEGSVYVYDVEAGRRLAGPLAHKGFITDMRFNRDGRRLIASSQQGGLGRVWDAETGKALTAPIKPGGRGQTAALDPDGVRAAVGGDGKVVVVSVTPRLDAENPTAT